jgi:hypothetical protein
MRLLFLDESGKLGEGGLFALGGIALRDRDWPELRDLWHETLAAHRWPLERELKWHGIRTGEVPPALADSVYDTLATAPFSAYVCVLDTDRGPIEFPPDEYAFFRSPEDVYATALMFLAERFQHLLADEDDVGAIVVDSPFAKTTGGCGGSSPTSPKREHRICGSTGSWKGSSSGRATSRSGSSARTSSWRRPPRRSVESVSAAATSSGSSGASRATRRAEPSRASG